LDGDFGVAVAAGAAALSPPHRLVPVDVDGLREAVAAAPVKAMSMGRNLDQDEAYFVGCAAAGRHAATLC
jgi:hypothetical protein